MDWRTPEDYGDVIEWLGRAAVRFVIVSGVAVVLHGHVRSIQDFDIVISADPDQGNRAMRALMAAGFAPTIPLPLSLLTVLRMFDPTGREVDLFVKYYVPFDELWETSVEMVVADHQVRVISLPHLITVKSSLGRTHDLSDLVYLKQLPGWEQTEYAG